MNRKERAINLGLKLNSLKGNFSVAKSVVKDLETEINEAVIDEADRERLKNLYVEIVKDLKSVVSPSTIERGNINQQIEDILTLIKRASSYQELEKLEGQITGIEENLEGNTTLKKEHRAALLNRMKRVRDKYKSRSGFYLKKNYDKLKRKILMDCDCENPFHVSVVVKKYNDIVKTTPLFTDDRRSIQALLDTKWQTSSKEIKEIKEADEK